MLRTVGLSSFKAVPPKPRSNPAVLRLGPVSSSLARCSDVLGSRDVTVRIRAGCFSPRFPPAFGAEVQGEAAAFPRGRRSMLPALCLLQELCLIRFHPATEEEEVAYISLYSYFSSRGRFGVVANNSRHVKDLYLIPLSAADPVPSKLLPFEGPGRPQPSAHTSPPCPAESVPASCVPHPDPAFGSRTWEQG